ncbi:hypothetical protein LTR50_003674 [Elasticomyces elasticus]|nr:hypothetical protein LTR50_003674 [Elasticomyces elasticus]
MKFDADETWGASLYGVFAGAFLDEAHIVKNEEDLVPCGCRWKDAIVELWLIANEVWTQRQARNRRIGKRAASDDDCYPSKTAKRCDDTCSITAHRITRSAKLSDEVALRIWATKSQTPMPASKGEWPVPYIKQESVSDAGEAQLPSSVTGLNSVSGQRSRRRSLSLALSAATSWRKPPSAMPPRRHSSPRTTVATPPSRHLPPRPTVCTPPRRLCSQTPRSSTQPRRL